MDTLRRRAPLLARLMLAWFAFTLCLGVAAGVHDPQTLAGLAGVCSVSDRSGSPPGDDGAGMGLAGHGGHCLLCLSPALPPAPPVTLHLPTAAADALPQWVAAPAPALRAFGPPAARGPPALA